MGIYNIGLLLDVAKIVYSLNNWRKYSEKRGREVDSESRGCTVLLAPLIDIYFNAGLHV